MSFGDQPAGGRPIWDFLNGGFEWLAGSVGVFFAEFRGEASGFPASQGIRRIVCLGFVCGDSARLAAEACDVGGRLRVQGERERCVEIVLVPW